MTESITAPAGGRVGPKVSATGSRAVCASRHEVVTQTMLDTLAEGGNAAGAAVAGSVVQAVVPQDMTNHTGTVGFLMYEAATGRVHELNSMGTIVPDLAPFHRVPAGHGLYASDGSVPFAVIPGFMPGMKAIHERFGSLPWARLVEPAVRCAEEGHVDPKTASYWAGQLGEVSDISPVWADLRSASPCVRRARPFWPRWPPPRPPFCP